MQNLVRHILICTALSGMLVGCTSNWSAARLEEKLTLRATKTSSNIPVNELLSRASHLEKIQEYEMAEELYAQVLKQDHENKIAQQRLTTLNRRKCGLPVESENRLPIRETYDESQYVANTLSRKSNLARISPGVQKTRPPFVDESLALKFREEKKTFSLERLQQSGEIPDWARTGVGDEQPSMMGSLEKQEAMRSFHQWVNESHDSSVSRTEIAEESVNRKVDGEVEPFSLSEQFIQDKKGKGPGVAQVSYSEVSIEELKKLMTENPRNSRVVDEMIKRLPNVNRTDRWQISSTLEVLMLDEKSKTIVLSRLSHALNSTNRNEQLMAISLAEGFGANADDLLPMLRLQLKDDDPAVQQAAARAIGRIGL